MGTATPISKKTSTIIYAPLFTERSQLTTNIADETPERRAISIKVPSARSEPTSPCARISKKPITTQSAMRKTFITIESELSAIAPLVFLPQKPLVPPANNASAKNKYPILISLI
jgi:hypothetical protein